MIFLRFPRETDNDIRSDTGIRDTLADLLHDACEAGRVVGSEHHFQDPITSTLKTDMKVRGDFLTTCRQFSDPPGQLHGLD